MAKNARSEHSWEQQPKESNKAFEAFVLYCEIGKEPGKKRSLAKVGQKLGKSTTLIERWSSLWNWQQRVRDYDNELKRQELNAKKKAYQDMQKRQVGMAIQLQKKAFEALQKLPVDKMTAKDIKEFMKLGAALERANMDIAIAEQSRNADDDTTVDIYLPEKDGDNGE